MNDQEVRDILRKKFNPDTWSGHEAFRNYEHANIDLIDQVNQLDPDLVVDVGCGHNRFKGHIKNLIGFDQEPFPFADMHCSIDEAPFRPESVDVALCLGSVQFGDHNKISRELSKIVDWVKPGGYIVMRVRHSKHNDIKSHPVHYVWDDGDIVFFSQKHNLEIVNGDVNIDDGGHTKYLRVVWWWKKPGELKRYQIDPIDCKVTER